MRIRAALIIAVIVFPSIVGSTTAQSATSLSSAFAAASIEHRVPLPVLLAVSYAETRWEDHGASPSFANGFGVMHLQDNPFNQGLREAAAALAVAPSVLTGSTAQNIRGGAALLRQGCVDAYPDDAALTRSADINRCFIPVARYLRSDQLQPQRDFADRVFTVMARGARSNFGLGNTIRLDPISGLRPDRGAYEGVPSDALQALGRKIGRSSEIGKVAAPFLSHVEGGGDQWWGSPNFWTGRSGYALSGIVIHTCESTEVSCRNTLSTSGTGKSAHYLVRVSDGWRYQFVHRYDTAWQCGDCTQSPFGNLWNFRTIGIEHEGFSATGYDWYSTTMYSRSAWLSAYACVNYGFSCVQGNGVWGHDYAQPGNSDPGPYWNWSFYMTCIAERIEFLQTGTWPPGATCP